MKVGEPLTLVAFAGDPDNLPARRDGKPQPRNASGRCRREAPQASLRPRGTAHRGESANLANLSRPPSSIVPSSGPGLRFSWIVYRGKAAAVTFTPDQMKTWTDTRAVRELAVVAAVRDSAAAAGRQVERAGDVRGAGHLRAARASPATDRCSRTRTSRSW